MPKLHGVPIHVTRDRLAHCVADRDRARVVHAAPHAGVVPICACLRDARVRAVRLSGRREGERLSVAKVAEKDGRGRPIGLGCPAGYSGCDGVLTRGSQSASGAVSGLPSVVCQRDRGHRPPRHFGRNRAIESLRAPDGEGRVGHRDVQNREQAVAPGHREMVGCAQSGSRPDSSGRWRYLPRRERAPSGPRCASSRSRDRAP